MPAATSSRPPATGAVRIESATIRVRYRPYCDTVIAALNPVHAIRYPAAKSHARPLRSTLRPRAIRAYISIIGLALGSIIAAIITVHIAKMSHVSRSVHGTPPACMVEAMQLIAPPFMPDTGIGIRASTNHAIAVNASILPQTIKLWRKGSRAGGSTRVGEVSREILALAGPGLLTAQPAYVNGENCPVLPERSSVKP